jgi:integrase
MYNFAMKRRHLPPYAGNPFAELPLDRLKIEDAKAIFVFDAATELAFLKAASAWAFPIHFTLAKTGLRIGELTHLLIEDLDLDGGWLHVHKKTELGWRIKTDHERPVPPAARGRGGPAEGDRRAEGRACLRPPEARRDEPQAGRDEGGTGSGAAGAPGREPVRGPAP